MLLNDFLAKLSEAFNTEPGKIALDSTQDSLEGWDSMGAINLITLIQDEFGIGLDMEELTGLSSVRDIVDTLVAKGVQLS